MRPRPGIHFNIREIQQLARETWDRTRKASLFDSAASLAYSTLLSIIPLLAVSLAIFKAFGGMEKSYDQIRPFILNNLAEGVGNNVITQLGDFVTNARASTFGLLGFGGLLVTSMSMLLSTESAINRVWAVKKSRTIFQQLVRYLCFILFGPLALSVLVGIASLGKVHLQGVLPPALGTFLLLAAFFFFIYKWVPNAHVRSRYALIAAAATAAAWTAARALYLIYTAHFVSYDKIYGGLGAIPILLLWMYIGWLLILSGAALTATLQSSQAAQNTRL
jgi:membrane protein